MSRRSAFARRETKGSATPPASFVIRAFLGEDPFDVEVAGAAARFALVPASTQYAHVTFA
jgi:hypothetical protein